MRISGIFAHWNRRTTLKPGYRQAIIARALSDSFPLPPFPSQDDFQIVLKIPKVILCSDLLGFHIIHHFPEWDSRFTGSTRQRQLAAAIQTRIVVELPVVYRPREEFSYGCRAVGLLDLFDCFEVRTTVSGSLVPTV